MATINVRDSFGQHVKGWELGTFKNHIQVGNSLFKPRKISGWFIRSNDGYTRYNEGNWQQFVPFARLVISNYGFTTNLS